MPLIEISHLRPSSPKLATIRKDRWEILAHVRYSLDRAADRRLFAKKRGVRKRPGKEKEQRAKASDHARIEKDFSKRHDEYEHRYECGYAEQVQAPCWIES